MHKENVPRHHVFTFQLLVPNPILTPGSENSKSAKVIHRSWPQISTICTSRALLISKVAKQTTINSHLHFYVTMVTA